MHTPGANATPITAAHVWRPLSYRRARASAAVFNASQRAWLREQRRHKVPTSPLWVAGILVASLLLHAVAWLAIDLGTRLAVPIEPASKAQRVIQVNLVEAMAQAVPSPPPPVPTTNIRPPAAAEQPSDRDAAPAPRSEPSLPRPPPDTGRDHAVAASLFDKQGDVILPAGATASGDTVAAFRHGNVHADARPNAPQSPIDYTPTRFENAWVPEDETLLGAAVRKTTVSGSVLTLPGGTQVKCALSILAFAGGCGLAPPDQMAPPLQVSNTRNSLPAATPLIAPAEAASRAQAVAAASVAAPVHAVPAPAQSVPAPAQSVPAPAQSAPAPATSTPVPATLGRD